MYPNHFASPNVLIINPICTIFNRDHSAVYPNKTFKFRNIPTSFKEIWDRITIQIKIINTFQLCWKILQMSWVTRNIYYLSSSDAFCFVLIYSAELILSPQTFTELTLLWDWIMLIEGHINLLNICLLTWITFYFLVFVFSTV